MRKDPVLPKDIVNKKFQFGCENCVYYSAKKKCVLGAPSKYHLVEVLLKQFELSGMMFLCRFMEVDD